MARKIMFKDAINEAMRLEMERDETVFLIGLDVAGGAGTVTLDKERDSWGGVLGVSKGLYPLFPDRVIDAPISESAYIGAAVGASACGMRAIGELMFADFMGVCFDQLYNQAAKFRYMFGGKAVTPVTIRTMIGAGFSAAAQHSQSPYSMFAHVPGLKCIIPSNPYDAKGLLAASIEDDDPCVFFEHKALYTMKGEVPEEHYTIPLGKANVVQEGKGRYYRRSGPHGSVRRKSCQEAGQRRYRVHHHRPPYHLADGLERHLLQRRENRSPGGC